MPRVVVQLRGVNVGKGNRVPMVEFKRLLEAIVAGSPWVPAKAEHSRFIAARVAYLHCPQDSLKGKVGAAVLGKAGRAVTARNRATVLKLEALLDAA